MPKFRLPVGYDQAAADAVHAIEGSVLRFANPTQGEFIALLNAIEAHVEEGDGALEVVRLLGDAFLVLGRYRGLTSTQIALLERKLRRLYAMIPPRLG